MSIYGFISPEPVIEIHFGIVARPSQQADPGGLGFETLLDRLAPGNNASSTWTSAQPSISAKEYRDLDPETFSRRMKTGMEMSEHRNGQRTTSGGAKLNPNSQLPTASLDTPKRKHTAEAAGSDKRAKIQPADTGNTKGD